MSRHKKTKEIGLFLFRRDLRIEDQLSLYRLSEVVDRILPVFILDDRQIDPERNPYFTARGFQFMLESIEDLNNTIRRTTRGCFLDVYRTEGLPTTQIEVIESIYNLSVARGYKITAVGWSHDATPFAIRRDTALREWCTSHNILPVETHDGTLLPLGTLRTATADTPYKKFTPFYQAGQTYVRTYPIPRPTTGTPVRFVSVRRMSESEAVWRPLLNRGRESKVVVGGRTEGLKRLRLVQQGTYENYGKTRDIPSSDTSSTMLSAYLKFGCISIREALEAMKGNEMLSRQLWWREFYYNIAYSFPHIFGHSFQPVYDGMKWENRKDWFERWCEGRTGFPIIDAGMRQLRETGWMHNRLRMMTSMFLTKDLLIDWRWGERYFATQLTDYDPAQNNGGWQWSSSTGVDSQPYFRIFNPWVMTQRVDPEATYIKQWVPELQSVPIRDILRWNQVASKYIGSSNPVYMEPMVDHSVQSKRAMELYRHR